MKRISELGSGTEMSPASVSIEVDIVPFYVGGILESLGVRRLARGFNKRAIVRFFSCFLNRFLYKNSHGEFEILVFLYLYYV